MGTADRAVHPKDRLLNAASRLFYSEGIHAVGVERLVTEASVTRATFYRHYPSKDDLVAAYLAETSRRVRADMEAAGEGKPPRAALIDILAVIGDATNAEDFRGCQFLNAAAELPDPAHQGHEVIAAHRKWLFALLHGQVVALGHPDPDYATRALILLHDGALLGGALDDAVSVREALRRAVEDLLPA